MVVWQPSTDTVWEFWNMERVQGAWHARWGGKLTNASSSRGYYTNPKDWGGSATSLSLLGGLIRPSDLRSGHIDHALALAIPHAAAGTFVAPAQRTDGNDHSPGAIPEGTRFRLNPKVDVNALHLPPVTKELALAVQRYGMIVRDQSGSVAVYGEDPTHLGKNPYQGTGGLFGPYNPAQLMRAFPSARPPGRTAGAVDRGESRSPSGDPYDGPDAVRHERTDDSDGPLPGPRR